MASISTDKRGNRRILFVDGDGRRKPIRVGKLPMRATAAIKLRVEALAASKLSGCGLDGETSHWLRSLPDELAAKLAAVGLIERREKGSLGDFLKAYIVGREGDTQPNTLANMKQAERFLVEYFTAGKRLRDIKPGDADEYRRWLLLQVGENTARRHLGRAKQFFRAAARKHLILESPFGDMKNVGVMANKDREFFVTREATEKVLAACPDNEWRLLFVLARYGGLRTPSEPLALTWGDVDWSERRIRVTSVKTAHHRGHGERFIPLFPEIEPYLAKAFEAAEPGASFVITRYRDRNSNLRTQLERIITRAGLLAWEKPFQNLRSTRETELVAEGYDIRDVCDWLGNSPSVALKHYLQRSDAGFKRAIGEAAQKQAQQPSATTSGAAQ